LTRNDPAVTSAGAVANDAEFHRWMNTMQSARHYVTPVAIETFGAMGDEAAAFLKDLGRRIAAMTKEHRATQYLMQRLSVTDLTVKRGNAVCVLGTLPDCCGMEELFYFT